MNTKTEYVLGYCRNHQSEISKKTFEEKGCWRCWKWFEISEDFPFYDVEEASNFLNISKSTVIRWINQGKIEGHLFKCLPYRYKYGFPLKKYYIKKISLESK